MKEYEIKQNLKKIMEKLYRKDRKTRERIIKEINKIINSNEINHYKNLRYNLSDFKRVQIGEKVLVFTHNKMNDKIIFEDFDHHDKIYKK